MALNDELLDRYDYRDDPVLKAALHAWDKMYIGAMMSYGHGITGFGLQMMAHQNRVAKDGANFLQHLGFSESAARNFRAAMLFHDIGKTHGTYNPSIWSLDDRPSPEEKEFKRRHARLGADMFRSLAEKNQKLLFHPHFQVRHAVTLYHHERADEGGPERLNVKKLPVFVQVSCIIDAYDGDRIQRPHQAKRRTKEEALLRLTGKDDPKKKYAGAFDKKLLKEYVAMKETE
jgi:response regulator RpfG family c-di-GMP phosphodiesterase